MQLMSLSSELIPSISRSSTCIPILYPKAIASIGGFYRVEINIFRL